MKLRSSVFPGLWAAFFTCWVKSRSGRRSPSTFHRVQSCCGGANNGHNAHGMKNVGWMCTCAMEAGVGYHLCWNSFPKKIQTGCVVDRLTPAICEERKQPIKTPDISTWGEGRGRQPLWRGEKNTLVCVGLLWNEWRTLWNTHAI